MPPPLADAATGLGLRDRLVAALAPTLFAGLGDFTLDSFPPGPLSGFFSLAAASLPLSYTRVKSGAAFVECFANLFMGIPCFLASGSLITLDTPPAFSRS